MHYSQHSQSNQAANQKEDAKKSGKLHSAI
jgi:hypothetical protein